MEELAISIHLSRELIWFVLLFLLICCSVTTTAGSFNGQIKEILCSPIKSNPSDPLSCDVAGGVGKTFQSQIEWAKSASNGTQEFGPTPNQLPCFLQYLCSDNIGGVDCRNCLVVATDDIMECAGYEGAHVTLVECTLRVENYKFY